MSNQAPWPADAFSDRVCPLKHDEIEVVKFANPKGLDVKQCPWHDADGSFDRQSYFEQAEFMNS